jgi:hypothetical protein
VSNVPNATVSATSIGGKGSTGGDAAAGALSFSSVGKANVTAIASGGNSFSGPGTGVGGAGNADASAHVLNQGSAVAQATGGSAGLFAGGASAQAVVENGGSAVAQATGGNGPAGGGFARATATSTAMLGGPANATAIGTGTLIIANSTATTINGNAAQAQSFATGFGFTAIPAAQATAQTNFGNFTSVQSTSASFLFSGTASATAQAGGVVSLSNPIIPGQSFSVVSGSGFGPLTVANGSMGAGYGGTGISVTYQQSVSFTQNGGAFVLDLLSNDALGKGFDSALFTISVNSQVMQSQFFTDLASAEAFFSNNLIGVPLFAGSRPCTH